MARAVFEPLGTHALACRARAALARRVARTTVRVIGIEVNALAPTRDLSLGAHALARLADRGLGAGRFAVSAMLGIALQEHTRVLAEHATPRADALARFAAGARGALGVAAATMRAVRLRVHARLAARLLVFAGANALGVLATSGFGTGDVARATMRLVAAGIHTLLPAERPAHAGHPRARRARLAAGTRVRTGAPALSARPVATGRPVPAVAAASVCSGRSRARSARSGGRTRTAAGVRSGFVEQVVVGSTTADRERQSDAESKTNASAYRAMFPPPGAEGFARQVRNCRLMTRPFGFVNFLRAFPSGAPSAQHVAR